MKLILTLFLALLGSNAHAVSACYDQAGGLNYRTQASISKHYRDETTFETVKAPDGQLVVNVTTSAFSNDPVRERWEFEVKTAISGLTERLKAGLDLPGKYQTRGVARMTWANDHFTLKYENHFLDFDCIY